MRTKIFPVLLVVFVLFSATDVNATGYRLYELGAKAATLAGAFTGRADNTLLERVMMVRPGPFTIKV